MLEATRPPCPVPHRLGLGAQAFWERFALLCCLAVDHVRDVRFPRVVCGFGGAVSWLSCGAQLWEAVSCIVTGLVGHRVTGFLNFHVFHDCQTELSETIEKIHAKPRNAKSILHLVAPPEVAKRQRSRKRHEHALTSDISRWHLYSS